MKNFIKGFCITLFISSILLMIFLLYLCVSQQKLIYYLLEIILYIFQNIIVNWIFYDWDKNSNKEVKKNGNNSTKM
jgi:hypothetical protein